MTALVHMAAARPPGIADARVPCPLCGGLIHPVAGKCKHCKEDLTSYRAGRPQAAAALPALNGKANGTNGHAMPPIVAAPVVPTGDVPILPPRPTARPMQAQRGPSVWKSWPMIVIALAAVAIVTATIIMIMPAGSKDAAKKISPSPAPERMDTAPLPEKQSSLDPWNQGGAAPDPQPGQPVPTPPTQDPDDDIWKDLNSQGMNAGFMVTAMDHACKKLASCPDIDPMLVKPMCEPLAHMPKAPPKANCPAAQRCLEKIDQMSCSQANAGNAQTLMYMVSECATAMSC